MQTYKRVKIAPYLLIGGLAALGLSGCMPGLPNGLMNKTAPVAGKARTGGSAVVPNTAPLSAIIERRGEPVLEQEVETDPEAIMNLLAPYRSPVTWRVQSYLAAYSCQRLPPA